MVVDLSTYRLTNIAISRATTSITKNGHYGLVVLFKALEQLRFCPGYMTEKNGTTKNCMLGVTYMRAGICRKKINLEGGNVNVHMQDFIATVIYCVHWKDWFKMCATEVIMARFVIHMRYCKCSSVQMYCEKENCGCKIPRKRHCDY